MTFAASFDPALSWPRGVSRIERKRSAVFLCGFSGEADPSDGLTPATSPKTLFQGRQEALPAIAALLSALIEISDRFDRKSKRCVCDFSLIFT